MLISEESHALKNSGQIATCGVWCSIRIESISVIDCLQLGRGHYPWYIHPPSFSSFATLSSCKTTMVCSRSLQKYLDQSYESRDQSGTLLKSISVIDWLQLGRGHYPWYIHPPSFSSFANLSSCKTTTVCSRSLGKYLDQSYKSGDQSGTLLKSISVID